jgi:PKD repeat protein
VKIKNNETAPIHNISVELDMHYYFNTTEPLEKEIPVLSAGKSHSFTWTLTPIDYGDLRIDVRVYTSDAGSDGKIVEVRVLSTPTLWITTQVPEKVKEGEDFILNATVSNSGDILSDNVTLNITLPANVTANRTSFELGIIEAHENKTCSFRIGQNESRDFMILLSATSLNATATKYAFIEINQPPVASFNYSPVDPVVNETIIFNASKTKDPDGVITNYEWHFGDGNVTNTTENTIAHSYSTAGNYTVNLTVTDNDGATNTSVARITVSNMPDLAITDTRVNLPDNCTICYTVTNRGNGATSAGHNTSLFVDGVEKTYDHVNGALKPDASFTGCFEGYNWTYTPPNDNVTVCADCNNTVEESNETNNCLSTVWTCGDVNYDKAVDMSDVIDLLYYVGYPGQYAICNDWAADVSRDGKIDMSDVRDLLYYTGYPAQYKLNCCCTGS